jgi:hypothetical protein
MFLLLVLTNLAGIGIIIQHRGNLIPDNSPGRVSQRMIFDAFILRRQVLAKQ